MTEQKVSQNSLPGFGERKVSFVIKAPLEELKTIVLNQPEIIPDKECSTCHGPWVMIPRSYDRRFDKRGKPVGNTSVIYDIGCENCGFKSRIGLVSGNVQFVDWEKERWSKP